MEANRLKKERLQRLKPMLAELVETPFDDKNWIFEVKFDGYRALAMLEGKGDVDLYSRNFISFNTRFSPLVKELSKIRHRVLLDGEVVIEDKKGISRFQLLQNYQRTGEGTIRYYVFDILHLDGRSTRDLPLKDRKELLELLFAKSKVKNIIFSEHAENNGKKFYGLAKRKGLEGIIAKDSGSFYHAGKRTGDWKKIKITQEQEAIICGITEPQGARKHFGSLILGAYSKGKLEYIGNAGTGFSESALKDLYRKFKAHFTKTPAFSEIIKTKGKIQWMKPYLVCEVKFSEWTNEMHMRHPVYMGLRVDKKASEVKPELPKRRS
jgi:bifunctional non-homologous end joining protein LigD